MLYINSYDFSGKRVLVRVDFNVPIDSQTAQITDDTRIRAALPTINYILQHGGSVVLLSHLGRPKGKEAKYSLLPVANRLGELLNKKIIFIDDCVGNEAFQASKNLKIGEVLLLENVRFYPQETQGEEEFARMLASHGDVYVNDAFGTVHRAHASTTHIAKYFPKAKFCGLLLEKEIKAVEMVLENTDKQVTAIIGGAKISSKITIIERLLEEVNSLLIGGGMAYTFIKAQGGEIGNSLVEDDFLATAQTILQKAKDKNVQIILPCDALIADKFDNEAQQQTVLTHQIPAGWMGLDIGQKTIEQMQAVILSSELILWNGPMGVFEFENFQYGTKKIAQTVVEATQKGAFSLVGGGDSVAALHRFHLQDDVSYVSTGGGAMLEYLEGKKLPGIQALD